jgi:hypothetical protein
MTPVEVSRCRTVADMFVDPTIYIADGYGNAVLIVDAATGKHRFRGLRRQPGGRRSGRIG